MIEKLAQAAEMGRVSRNTSGAQLCPILHTEFPSHGLQVGMLADCHTQEDLLEAARFLLVQQLARFGEDPTVVILVTEASVYSRDILTGQEGPRRDAIQALDLLHSDLDAPADRVVIWLDSGEKILPNA